MLIEKVEKANIQALKDRDSQARAVLTIVITRYRQLLIEARTEQKEVTDNDLVRVIAKVVKELNEEKEGYIKVKNEDMIKAISHQEEVVKAFLPKMMSEQEIIAEIGKLSDKSIPSIMKHFKNEFDGKVDMGLVNRLARTL
ncbi:MAG: GatB/YqeY domain-containing protein [Erysipelotrichia bacterium]|jgi:uncharacterized protein YqeY|nr:GatB/YqeY domain-containing protein [Bacilli bacterium]MDD4006185.1 GatB/YqeY domain-containing protein [Bacilli bacterium]NMV82373.1 GatB/YqeY domain-containing protein [Erysipelotrichia bacterium]